MNSGYFKYLFIKEGHFFKNYFLLRNLQYSFELFCFVFFVIWEYIDQLIDSLSFNYDQFRIYYYDRVDVINQELLFGRIS